MTLANSAHQRWQMLPNIPLSHLNGPPDPERRLRLLEIVRRTSREVRYSRRTEEAYVFWIRRFILHNDRRHPKEMGEAEVRTFLSMLAVEEHVAASTQNQAMAALRFLYERVLRVPLNRVDGIVPAKRPPRVPIVLSKREIRAIFRQLSGECRLSAELMYGSGLRVLECVSLRVKDVDLDRREIVVRGGKGDRDRRTPIAESCVPALARQLKSREEECRRDTRLGIRASGISEALMRKYPNADAEWRWQYVMAAARTFVDASGVRRRHHFHETSVQRAVKAAAGDPVLRSVRRAIRFATRLRRICLNPAQTFALCRNFSVIRTCVRR